MFALPVPPPLALFFVGSGPNRVHEFDIMAKNSDIGAVID